MKNKFIVLIIFCFINSIVNAQEEQLNINTTKSKIRWESELVFHFSGHYGHVSFKEGHFIKKGDVISGGEFLIDMNTISDEEGNTNSGLANHLKDPDFFEVQTYPTAKLVMNAVQYEKNTRMKIKADLTIKGITKPIIFYAEVDYEKKQMLTKFKIDRTRWGVTYNNKLKNDAISDAIKFEVLLSL